jgi:2-(1,2-epoxy-1,2-dihydrophenyl)acetyl-CoA isomerase
MTDAAGHILYSVAAGVATITFNRPDALNALLPEMGDQLAALVDRAEADEQVRVIVLTGAGRAFSAGADLKLMGRGDRLGRSALVGRERNLHGSGIVERLLARDKPMIAAVNGVAAGMACAYVLAADFAVAADTAKLVFGFTKLGFVPDCGNTWLLPRRVGLANAQRIALTAEPVGATEGLRLGLFTEVVPAAELAARADGIARTIASRAPHAVRLARMLLARNAEGDFRQAVEAEALAQGILGETEDHKEAVRAFAEKRDPVFQGR